MDSTLQSDLKAKLAQGTTNIPNRIAHKQI